MYQIPERDFPSKQAFVEFSNKLLELETNADATYHTSVQNEVIAPSTRKKSSKVKRTLLTIAFVLLGIPVFLGLNWLYVGGDQFFVNSEEISAGLNDYITKMMSRDIEKAASFFFNANDETIAFLSTQVDGINYALYSDYQGIEITDWNLLYEGSNGEAEVSGRVLYANGFEGAIYALLVTSNGQWVITSVTVYATPAKIESFIRESLSK